MKGVRVVACVVAFAPFLVVSPGLRAADDVPAIVARTVQAYGGKAALEKATRFRATARVTATQRGPGGTAAVGTMTRSFEAPGKLRVVVELPDQKTEVRVLDGEKGWRSGVEAKGPMLDAMRLQAARLALPLALVGREESLVDRGEVARDGKTLRALELPLGESLKVEVQIDPASGRILRSIGRIAGGDMGSLEFVTDFDDFREVAGVLVPFRESNQAMGRKTADTVFEKVEAVESFPAETWKP